jgi:hypothetical protein
MESNFESGVHPLCKIRAVNAASETRAATLIHASRIEDHEDPFDGLATHRAALAYDASCVLRAEAAMAARDGRHGRRPLEADDAHRCGGMAGRRRLQQANAAVVKPAHRYLAVLVSGASRALGTGEYCA